MVLGKDISNFSASFPRAISDEPIDKLGKRKHGAVSCDTNAEDGDEDKEGLVFQTGLGE